MHKQPAIKKKFPKNIKTILPVSEMLYREGLALPIHSNVKIKDIDFICKLICGLSE